MITRYKIELSNFNGSTLAYRNITIDIKYQIIKDQLNPQKRNLLNDRNCRG